MKTDPCDSTGPTRRESPSATENPEPPERFPVPSAADRESPLPDRTTSLPLSLPSRLSGVSGPSCVPTITDLLRAALAQRGRIRRTPMEPSGPLSERVGAEVFLKWENQQTTGSFKLRGAYARLEALSPEERVRGIATVSAGNHALAVAQAAAELRIPATIHVPGSCPEAKKAAIRDRGEEFVELRVIGRFYDEAEVEARTFAEERGLPFVSPHEDRTVAAGQGTLALEMLEEEPELDLILCPASGGGLIAGVLVGASALRPGIRVHGVYPRANPSWPTAWSRGEPIPVEESDSYADALSGGVSPRLFPFLRENLAGILGATEEEIGRAMAFLFREHQQVVEGAGAVGVAALLADKIAVEGLRVGVVVSGGNVEERRFLEVLRTFRD